MGKRSAKSIVVGFVSLLLTSAVAFATTFANRPISVAANEATNIVRGTAGESFSNWDSDHKRIYTYTRLEVTDVLKGSLNADTQILVRQPGGTIDDTTMGVPGTASFVPDEDVVVLLGPYNKADDSYDVPGFTTGKYNVVKGENGEPMLINSMGGGEIYDPHKNPKTQNYNSKIPLEVFRHVAKGEDVPEAAHAQFHDDEQRPGEVGQTKAPASDRPGVQVPTQENSGRRWVPLSFVLVAVVGGAVLFWVMRSKES